MELYLEGLGVLFLMYCTIVGFADVIASLYIAIRDFINNNFVNKTEKK